MIETNRALAFLACCALAPGARGQCSEGLLTHVDLGSFGYRLAVSGDTLMVTGAGSPAGPRVVVYERQALGWIETDRLFSPSGGPFAWDVAIQGERAVVGGGSPFQAGRAYVFERQAGAWTAVATVQASDAMSNDYFGVQVELDGDRFVVGSRAAAYVFERHGASWIEVVKFDSGAVWPYGLPVAVSGRTVVVGDPWFPSSGQESGVVRVFEGLAGGWTQTAQLVPSGQNALDEFGYALAIEGARVLVGARFADPVAGADTGAAYVFEHDGGAWHETARLGAQGLGSPAYFGFSVALDGDRALIGAPLEDAVAPDSGAAFLFHFADPGWLEIGRFAPSLAETSEGFGNDTALGASTLFVGTGEYSNTGTGKVYLFEGAPRTIGTRYCVAEPNSTGASAAMLVLESADPALRCFTLQAHHTALNQFGYFLMAPAQGFVHLFGGSEGNLCLGFPIVRFDGDILFTGARGAASMHPDLAQLPQIGTFAPGSTWNFQFWFRDIDPYFTSNTTDAIAMTLRTTGDPSVQFPVTTRGIEEQTTQIEVLVTLSQPSSQDVAVPFTESGTATPHVDYRIESPNPLPIPAGQSSTVLVITVAEDSETESDETVTVHLRPPANAVLGTASAFTLTILDDD